MNLPTLESMLKAGVHFGHKVSNWHPRMAPFIFTKRQGFHVIDLRMTQESLEKIYNYVKEISANGGTVLFVGTKNQLKKSVVENAQKCDMPYVTERWIGGLFTNFRVVNRLAKKLTQLKKEKDSGELQKYTKKEQVQFQKEIVRLQALVGGIEKMDGIPQVVFVTDIKNDKTALFEANKKNVPVIAICDSNVNPDNVDYIIPANDDSVKSVDLIASVIADAVLAGKNSVKK